MKGDKALKQRTDAGRTDTQRHTEFTVCEVEPGISEEKELEKMAFIECTCDIVVNKARQAFGRVTKGDCPVHGLGTVPFKELESTECPTIQRVETVKIGEKYHIHFDRAASANKTDGFKVEVNSDNLEEAKRDALALYEWAIGQLKPFPVPEVKAPAKFVEVTK